MNEYLIIAINIFIVGVGLALIRKVANGSAKGLSHHYLTIKDHTDICFGIRQQILELVRSLLAPIETKMDMLIEQINELKRTMKY